MAIREVDAQDWAIIRSCLHFVLESGELAGEFQTRMGVDEAQVRAILSSWPHVDGDDDSPSTLAINNALNEVCHGLSPRADWSRWFSVPPDAVLATYRRWATQQGWEHTGVR